MTRPRGGGRLSRRELLRLGMLGAAAAGAAGLTTSCASAAIPGATARGGQAGAGGRLRVGVVGGSIKDTLDAHIPVTHPDQARLINMYDGLATFDDQYRIQLALAESIEPSADAKVWTVRLRDGLEFHNGKPVTAEDVAFTLRRIIDPDDPKSGATGFASVDAGGMQVLDPRTLRLTLATPDATLLDSFAQYSNGIVPVGYDPANPIGAGPFRNASFQPGQQSVFLRHDNHWRPNEPQVAELVIIDFPDDTARVNALLGGQVDAIDQLPIGLMRVVEADPSLRVLEAETGAWLPFTMRVDRPPFDDVRVRQAMRLVVDREQMVRQVLSGRGKVGNDLYAPFDPGYAADIPQRTRDIAQARRLLQEAGKENLQVELVTSAVAAGVVEAAQVYAEQAKEAGITVTIRKVDSGEFYGDNYLQWDFAQDFWFTRNFLPQTAVGSLPDAPYNETHWADPEFIDIVNRAKATVDETARNELIRQAQRIEHERGGYIVWGFGNQVDAYSRRLAGFTPDRGGIPLSGYNFRKVGFTA
ncbi:ABC transporter substrate-binding protein [Pseudonocardia sp. TRM90224]|uniref:ABC transporter substrate-binding protein n=1 Tax=Pseudonocardia sp. TRM90224 TaxID=2812678 RepID=UPI001E4B8F96|nr:ABC transporter substrate-binding protein [Pseudonocardia sp. TRM90224]